MPRASAPEGEGGGWRRPSEAHVLGVLTGRHEGGQVGHLNGRPHSNLGHVEAVLVLVGGGAQVEVARDMVARGDVCVEAGGRGQQR